MQWFYILNGQRLGPVDESELFRLAREGALTPGDLVWNPTMGTQWQPASSVPNLFGLPTPAMPEIPGATPNGDLMRKAVESLNNHWALAIGATLLYQVVVGGIQFIPYLGILLIFVLSGPMMLGFFRFFLKMARNQTPEVGQLFDGFKMFGKSCGAYVLVTLFMLLWSLPMIASGLIAAIAIPLIQHNAASGFLLIPAFAILAIFGFFLVIRATLAYRVASNDHDTEGAVNREVVWPLSEYFRR